MENSIISDKRPVLVTGAGGFIASHLVELLVADGYDVRAFVRYNSRADIGLLATCHAATLAHVEIVFGDLRDSDAVVAAARGCSTVYHLGALIAIPYSYVHPREVIETNVIGTLNVLEAARGSGVERVVHVSTSEVYGTAQTVPIDEQHRLRGQSPYSASKIGADKVAESYHLAFDVPVVTIRPFNTYGPRQSARAVIPTIISQVLHSDVVRLGSTTPTRDFTFVTDTARAMQLAGTTPGIEGLTINAGSGAEISVGDLVQRIMTIAGIERTVEVDADRLRPVASEVDRLLADASVARDRLGWTPQVRLDDGLTRVIQWIRANPERFRPSEYQR